MQKTKCIHIKNGELPAETTVTHETPQGTRHQQQLCCMCSGWMTEALLRLAAGNGTPNVHHELRELREIAGDIQEELRELRELYSGLVRHLRDNKRQARQRVRTTVERSAKRSAASGHQPTAEDLARVRKKLQHPWKA